MAVYAHDLALALAQAVAGELAEGALGRARGGQDLALEHQLGVGRHQHVGGLALHELERLAEQGAHDGALVLVDGADGQGAQRDGRVHADGEGHRQRLAARLGDLGNSHRCLPSVRWIDVVSRPLIIRRL